MKIVDVKADLISAPLKIIHKASTYTYERMQSVLVTIETDEGIKGYGEAMARFAPRATKLIIVDGFREKLIGRDPLDIEVIWRDLFSLMRPKGHYKGYFIEALSGIDIALWDVIGKYFGKPIYKLIGGKYRDKLYTYYGSIAYTERGELLNEVKKYLDMGFKAIKLKIGFGIREDIERIKTIREELGYDFELFLDATSAYNVTKAIKLATSVEKYEISWLEEPVPPEDLEGYKEIKKKTSIPIAGGESLFTKIDFKNYITEGALDIIQPSVSRAGGITETKKILALAEAYDLMYAPFVGFNSIISLAASMHLSASSPIFYVQEYDPNPNPLKHDIVKERIDLFENGYLKVPEKPGLGIEIDESYVEKVREG